MGNNPTLSGLTITMVINHLQTGMILQVVPTFLLRSPFFPMIRWISTGVSPSCTAPGIDSVASCQPVLAATFNQWLAAVQFSWFSSLGEKACNITSIHPKSFQSILQDMCFVSVFRMLSCWIFLRALPTSKHQTNDWLKCCKMEWYTVLVVIGMFVSLITEKR